MIVRDPLYIGTSINLSKYLFPVADILSTFSTFKAKNFCK